MTVVPEDRALDLLRAMVDKLDRLLAGTSELKVCMARIENGSAVTSARLDRVDLRLARIEGRLGGSLAGRVARRPNAATE